MKNLPPNMSGTSGWLEQKGVKPDSGKEDATDVSRTIDRQLPNSNHILLDLDTKSRKR